jgi:hypothetical protein
MDLRIPYCLIPFLQIRLEDSTMLHSGAPLAISSVHRYYQEAQKDLALKMYNLEMVKKCFKHQYTLLN